MSITSRLLTEGESERVDLDRQLADAVKKLEAAQKTAVTQQQSTRPVQVTTSDITAAKPLSLMPDTKQMTLLRNATLAIGTDGKLYVVNDGHSHTGASLSGIDMASGADTNIAVTSPIVLTGHTLSLDSSAIAQTPWTEDIDADGYDLNDAGDITIRAGQRLYLDG